MGGDGASEAQPINLNKPAPDWVFQKLDYLTDPDENQIYTQLILAHPLYSYSL